MNRIYLEQIVEVMLNAKPSNISKAFSESYQTWANIVRELGEAFQAIDPNFDADQFSMDCGIG